MSANNPQEGEIWRCGMNGSLLLASDERDPRGDVLCVGISGVFYGLQGYIQLDIGDTLAYPDLPAAVAAGEKLGRFL